MTIHHFQPTQYYTTLGAHPPARVIADGDTVITTTVDAAGLDAHEAQATTGGNPQTGPFFVEGAEPGDTLVLHLDALRPNRTTGWSSSVLAANVVDPEYATSLPPRQRAQWTLDLERGTARLAAPPPGLESLELAFDPMLGCFGVAPEEGQAISTATSGPHGGNMDYRGFRAGVTVYLPVFEPGALLFLGDGHAVQGDGEISGTGIETSFGVQFTVRVQKGKHIQWPRGENAESIFTVGNARPLDQALQHATTEMVRWLLEDYGLDMRGASMLMGQCVAYDIANIYDPAYTVVCKMPKKTIGV